MVCNLMRPFFACLCQDRHHPMKEKEVSLLPEQEMQHEKEPFLLPERSKELESRNAALKDTIQAVVKLPRKTSLTEDKSSVIDSIYQGNRKACQEWFANALVTRWEKSIVISVIKTDEFLDEAETIKRIKELQNLTWLHINVKDDASAWSGEEGIKSNLSRAFKLIDQARIEGLELLIHCSSGQSRSSTIIAAYLMWSTDLPFQDVTVFMRSNRNFAAPSGDLKEALLKDFPLLLDQGISVK